MATLKKEVVVRAPFQRFCKTHKDRPSVSRGLNDQFAALGATKAAAAALGLLHKLC